MDLISILLSVFHILSALLVIVAVLLQSGKGGGLAGLGGGSSSAAATQMFGGGGAGNFLSRSTVVLATIFMATSLAMAYIAAKPNSAMDLGETAGGVASQEDPILEEGTGPVDFETTPEATKLDAPAKLEVNEIDAAKKALEKIAAEKAAATDLKEDTVEAVEAVKKDAVDAVEKTVKPVEKAPAKKAPAKKAPVKKAPVKTVEPAEVPKKTEIKDAVKKVEEKAKEAVKKVEDSVKPTTP